MKKILITLVAAACLVAAGLVTATADPASASSTSVWTGCASSEQGPPYVVIVKGVYGTCVHYAAQVFQFDSVTGTKSMLVYITNDGDGVWDDLVWVNLSSASLGSSIYENDIVYLVGRLDGTYTYTSTLSTNTVPVIDVTQLRLANAKPTTTTTVKPTTTPTTVAPLGAVQSPASYLLTKSNAPAGWTEQTIEGTGFPKLLSALCTPKESRAQMCATAGVRFVAKGGVQSVVEGLVNWATQTEALNAWTELAASPGYTRVSLGHFGTASRTLALQGNNGVVYTTYIAKGHFNAIVEYAGPSGPTARLTLSTWTRWPTH